MGNINRVALGAVLALTLPSVGACSSSSSPISTNCCSVNGACLCEGQAGDGCTVQVTAQGATCNVKETCVQGAVTSTAMIQGGMPTTTCSAASTDGG